MQETVITFGKITTTLYGPVSRERLAKEQAITKHRHEQLYSKPKKKEFEYPALEEGFE